MKSLQDKVGLVSPIPIIHAETGRTVSIMGANLDAVHSCMLFKH